MPIRTAMGLIRFLVGKKGFVIAAVILMMAFGYLIHFYGSSKRGPAAINHSELFQDIKPEDIDRFAKEILTDARIDVQKQQSVVYLNIKRDTCVVYDRVELRFEAEGVAVNGQRPALVVDGPCVASNEEREFQMLHIPVESMRPLRPTAGSELSFSTHPGYFYRAENFDGEWPDHWVLTDIRGYKNTSVGIEFKIGRREIYKYSPRPLHMIW